MFVQIIEGQVKDADGMKRLAERWQTELRPGATGYLGVTSGVTDDGKGISIVRFESADAARANSERPEQGAWFAEMAKCYDGEPTFSESSDTEEFMGGGNDSAGFVQIMKTPGGLDRDRVHAMDAAFEKFAGERSDLLGMFRAWTGPDSAIDIAYFTSEADARAGESKEMPPEMQKLMADFGDMMQGTEFLDLKDPILK
ncbi:MAG: hypothetical protein QOF21_1055 [Actinomycetota bacterium]|jgi:hypothetical protein